MSDRLSSILTLTPEDVLRGHLLRNGGEAPHACAESREEWRRIQTAQRLAWHHGYDHAAQIIAGNDLSTNLDVYAWRALGQSKSDRGRA